MTRKDLLMHQIRSWSGSGHENEKPVCGAGEPEYGFLQKAIDLRECMSSGLADNPCAACLAATEVE